jgi:hypothetical protein
MLLILPMGSFSGKKSGAVFFQISKPSPRRRFSFFVLYLRQLSAISAVATRYLYPVVATTTLLCTHKIYRAFFRCVLLLLLLLRKKTYIHSISYCDHHFLSSAFFLFTTIWESRKPQPNPVMEKHFRKRAIN